MPISRSLIVIVVLAVASGAAGQDKQRLVEEQIRYIEHLQKAESHLEAEKPDAALAELETALSCDVPDSNLPYPELKTKGAVAHYLRACAYAMKRQEAAAIKSLRAAAANGYRNTALVKSDPRLAELRQLESFAEILKNFPDENPTDKFAGKMFPDENPTDKFAGKMVANRKFGISLQMHRKGNFPKLGEVAPDFELDLLGKEQTKLRLSAFRGKKPVMLIFGSFT